MNNCRVSRLQANGRPYLNNAILNMFRRPS